MIKVRKRNGDTVPLHKNRIFNSIFKCCMNGKSGKDDEQSRRFAEKVTNQVIEEINFIGESLYDVEEIQSIVMNKLADQNKVVAHDYLEYKTDRDLKRMENRDLKTGIKRLLAKDKSIVNENANKDSRVYNTQRDLTAGVVAKSIGLDMLPPYVAKAHEDGDLHYHDLDYGPYSAMTNCCLIDFKEMLTNGFKIGNAEVEPPKSIQTATAQMSQIIANVASSQYGGCSADRTDELLAPFAEKNYQKHLAKAAQYVFPEMREKYAKEQTKKDIYDAMQSLEYEINTLYTSNG